MGLVSTYYNQLSRKELRGLGACSPMEFYMFLDSLREGHFQADLDHFASDYLYWAIPGCTLVEELAKLRPKGKKK